MNKYSPWSKKDDHTLFSGAGVTPTEELARKLNRTISSVNSRVGYLRRKGVNISLRKYGENHHSAKCSNADADICLELYESGIKMSEIARKMELTYGTILNICCYRRVSQLDY